MPGVIEHLEPFATDSASAGSGLGLAIVEMIAIAYGGAASAANVEGGAGVVELRLPLAR